MFRHPGNHCPPRGVRRRTGSSRSRSSDNIDLDAAVVKNDSVIAAYATRRARPDFPFWPMLFGNVTIRRLGSDDFPVESKDRGRPPASCLVIGRTARQRSTS